MTCVPKAFSFEKWFLCSHNLCRVNLSCPSRTDPSVMSQTLPVCLYRFAARLRAIRLRAGKPDYIPLSVETGNTHWTVVRTAAWLVGTNKRRFTAHRSHVFQPYAKQR